MSCNEEIRVAEKFFADKIAKEKKTLKVRLIVGTLVTIIVFGYLFWLNRFVTDVGTPEGIRKIVVTTMRAQAKPLVDMAKKEILGHKTDLIQFLTKEGLDNLVKILIKEGESSFQGLIARITNETVDELNLHFVTVLKNDSSGLRAVLADPDVTEIERKIVDAFDNDLQKSMGDMNFDEDFKEPLSKKYAESIKYLNDINDKLKELAESKTLSRRETLIVRFIKSWTSYVNQAGDSEPPKPKPQRPGAPAPAPAG
jgi:hypothetical protein